jgi:hypothetical protein
VFGRGGSRASSLGAQYRDRGGMQQRRGLLGLNRQRRTRNSCLFDRCDRTTHRRGRGRLQGRLQTTLATRLVKGEAQRTIIHGLEVVDQGEDIPVAHRYTFQHSNFIPDLGHISLATREAVSVYEPCARGQPSTSC